MDLETFIHLMENSGWEMMLYTSLPPRVCIPVCVCVHVVHDGCVCNSASPRKL